MGREANLATIVTLFIRWKFELLGALGRVVKTIAASKM